MEALTQILWIDAVGDGISMSLDDLKEEMMKYPGLAQGLARRCISICIVENIYKQKQNMFYLSNIYNKINKINYSIGKWFFPTKKQSQPSYIQRIGRKLFCHLNVSYWRENQPLIVFLVFLFGVNITIFVERLYYYRHLKMLNYDMPNIFFMFSRANG